MPEDEIRRIFAKNLRDMMCDRGLAQKDIAKICRVSTSSVSTWCKGINIPRMDKIEMLAQYFGIKKSDLIQAKREQKALEGILQIKRIPLLGRIAAGSPIYAEENIEGYTSTDLNGGNEYFGLRVHGDSMDAAGIRDGYTVIVRRQDVVEEGQIAVCLIDGQDATLKRFSQEGNIVTLMPQSTNPEHKPFVVDITKTQVKILGLVVRAEFSLV